MADPTTAPLPTRPLAPGGPPVSTLALGTMTFGAETDEAGARAQLDAFVAAGGTHIDTANVYGGGRSEEFVGRWLADHPDVDVLLATKGRFPSPEGLSGASRVSLTAAFEGSLRRLARDRVDLYVIHGWDEETPVAQTLELLSELIAAGRIGAVGWSNVTGYQLQRIMTTARLGGYAVPVTLQPQYNLLDRGIEWEVLPCCLDEGLGVTPWSPLGGGWLTGKYRREDRPTGATRLGEDPDRGVEAYDTRNTERTWRILDVVERIAGSHGRPMGHVALAWLLGRPGVSTVLLGARTLEQLTTNLGAADLVLTDDERSELDAVSAPGLPPYPYGMVEDFCAVPHWRTLSTR